MIYKNAARMIFLAAFLFVPVASAQDTIGGKVGVADVTLGNFLILLQRLHLKH